MAALNLSWIPDRARNDVWCSTDIDENWKEAFSPFPGKLFAFGKQFAWRRDNKLLKSLVSTTRGTFQLPVLKFKFIEIRPQGVYSRESKDFVETVLDHGGAGVAEVFLSFSAVIILDSSPN
jgi:hypothetical protein